MSKIERVRKRNQRRGNVAKKRKRSLQMSGDQCNVDENKVHANNCETKTCDKSAIKMR